MNGQREAKEQTEKKWDGQRKEVGMWWRLKEVREMEPVRKMIAWYCFQGPQSVGPGLFYFSEDEACGDLDLRLSEWMEHFPVILKTFGWHYDEEARVLWIPDWFEWHEVESKRDLLRLLKCLNRLPPTPWFAEFKQQIPPMLTDALKTVWLNWFEPSETPPPPKPKPKKLPPFAQLTTDDVPEALDLLLRPHAPSEFRLMIAALLYSHCTTAPHASPPHPDDDLKSSVGQPSVLQTQSTQVSAGKAIAPLRPTLC